MCVWEGGVVLCHSLELGYTEECQVWACLPGMCFAFKDSSETTMLSLLLHYNIYSANQLFRDQCIHSTVLENHF